MAILYKFANDKKINITYFPMKKVKAFSIPSEIILNPAKIKTNCELKEGLAHELGHQATGSFYRVNSKFETRERMEERATRWAVQYVIPAKELKEALQNGCTEVWQPAEYFDISKDFIQDTIRVHKVKGNI